MVDYIFLEKYTKDIEVLFVEDDEAIRKETKELLEDIFQKEISIAKDGAEGFEKYMDYYEQNNRYFDLIITDIQMPKMNGIELSKKIYKQNSQQALIVLSAYNDSEYLMELINLGISQFILKPLNYDNFVDVIYKVSKKIYFNLNDEAKEEEKTEIKLSDDLYWDTQIKQLKRDGELLKTTKKESLLLELLLKSPEKTHTNEEIIVHLWSDDEDKSPDITNLKNILTRFRKKIPDINIENIYSFGYRIHIIEE